MLDDCFQGILETGLACLIRIALELSLLISASLRSLRLCGFQQALKRSPQRRRERRESAEEKPETKLFHDKPWPKCPSVVGYLSTPPSVLDRYHSFSNGNS